MKVLLASTPEQEEEIQNLIRYMYSSIFPEYFTDHEIKKFDSEWQVLHIETKNSEYVGTMQEALQIITSLNTMISIIESCNMNDVYEEMFYHNVEILQGFGMFFPFSFQQFSNENSSKQSLSMYSKADNHLLV